MNSIGCSVGPSSSAIRSTHGSRDVVDSTPSSAAAVSLMARRAAFSSRRMARLRALRSPCLVALRFDRSFPAGVRGPVLRSHGLFLPAASRRDWSPSGDSR
jgi:hypothetical protein